MTPSSTSYLDIIMTKIDKNFDSKNWERTKKYEQDWKLELFALVGFCISGAIFILSGIKNGDILAILGSLVWIISCVTWMIPYRKYFATSKHKHDCRKPITGQIESDK